MRNYCENLSYDLKSKISLICGQGDLAGLGKGFGCCCGVCGCKPVMIEPRGKG